ETLGVDVTSSSTSTGLVTSIVSAAASTTNRLRDNGNMRFTDMAAASVSMSFITFALMAASSVLSGYALSKHIH
ncbi:hypothetical protein KI387_008577, partial [Taxus chinensis]